MMDRDPFINNLARAAASGRINSAGAGKGPVVPDGDPLSRTELIDRFAMELAAVGGLFHRAGDESAATGIVAGILDREDPGGVLVDESCASLMPEMDREIFRYAGERDDDLISRAAACAVGVGRAVAGVAETGSVVVAAAHGRGVSLLPPCQVTVLWARDIHLTVGDCLSALSGEGWTAMGSGSTFITGPSKTGDIESNLVLGVHGPGRTHVIVIKGD
jgi:L-lactate utilization protein LutB